MNIGRNLTELRVDATNGLYQNLNYQTERVSKKNLIIDTAYCSSNGENGDFKNHTLYDNENKEFRCELTEKLIIDRLSEVYIDAITFMGLDKTGETQSEKIVTTYKPIYLDIKQFPLHNYTNNPKAKHKYLITENWDSGSEKAKTKKMNYLCTLNPMTIEELDITLEYENIVDKTMDSIFNDGYPLGRAIIELVIISKD
tara:strand:- start:415 stop:1011 length:597 start_codon:yes stop_codon:yes gene_type:complete